MCVIFRRQGFSGRGRHVESGLSFRGGGGVGSEEKPHSSTTHSDGHCHMVCEGERVGEGAHPGPVDGQEATKVPASSWALRES